VPVVVAGVLLHLEAAKLIGENVGDLLLVGIGLVEGDIHGLRALQIDAVAPVAWLGVLTEVVVDAKVTVFNIKDFTLKLD
jgi:hypothetical protein